MKIENCGLPTDFLTLVLSFDHRYWVLFWLLMHFKVNRIILGQVLSKFLRKIYPYQEGKNYSLNIVFIFIFFFVTTFFFLQSRTVEVYNIFQI